MSHETLILTHKDFTTLTLKTSQIPFSLLFSKVLLELHPLSTTPASKREWRRLPKDRHLNGLSFRHSNSCKKVIIKLFQDTDELVLKNEYLIEKLGGLRRGEWSEILRRFEMAFFQGFKGEELELDSNLRNIFQRDVLRVDEMESVFKGLGIVESVPPLMIEYEVASKNEIRKYVFPISSKACYDMGNRRTEVDARLDEREAELEQMLRWSLRTRSILNSIAEDPVSTLTLLLRSEEEDKKSQQIDSIRESVYISGLSSAYASMTSGGLGTSAFV